MNGDFAEIKEVLDEAGVTCACILLKDGRTIEIDCACRCRKELARVAQKLSKG